MCSLEGNVQWIQVRDMFSTEQINHCSYALQLCVAVMTMRALLSALLFDNDYVLNERTDKLHQPFENGEHN